VDPSHGALRFFAVAFPRKELRERIVKKFRLRQREVEDGEVDILVRGFGRRFREELELPERLPHRIAALVRQLGEADRGTCGAGVVIPLRPDE